MERRNVGYGKLGKKVHSKVVEEKIEGEKGIRGEKWDQLELTDGVETVGSQGESGIRES